MLGSEGQLQALIDRLPIGIGTIDARGRTLSLNQAGLELHGFQSLDEMIVAFDQYKADFQLRDLDGRLIPPDDWPLARALRGEFVSDMEVDLRRPDGARRIVSYSAKPMPEDPRTEVCVAFVMVDRTQHHRAEQALRASEERYRSLFRNIDQGFCVIEVLFDDAGEPKDYLFLEINHVFESQTGIRNAVGRRMRDIAPHHENHWFDTFGHVARTGESRRFDHAAEALGRHFDVFAYRVGHPDEHRVAILFQDISDRLRHEAALREADRRKDEFLATLAHELRNPLAPLRYAMSLLALSGDDPGTFQQTREMMERQLNQMVHLIDDLLDVSRINSGKILLRRGRVDLRSVIDSALETVSPLIEQQNHTLSVSYPNERIELDADSARLAQVFANLLSNAAKYTDPGGRIDLNVRRDGEAAIISVRDSGIGIPAHHLPRLFERFSQVAPALERTQGGLGLGLSLVKDLVELHGGSVGATSAGLGLGSEFTVRLPIPKPEVSERAMSTNQPSPATEAALRVLVVDDNHDVARMMALLLRAKKQIVQTAESGYAALEAIPTFQPEVVLLDIGMPGIDGFETLRRIREQFGSQLFVVAMTGWGQEADRQKALESGFNRHLVKPVDPKAMDELLREVPRR
jgi:signal transduction histidine kinase/CheY-like chemotaxis protein